MVDHSRIEELRRRVQRDPASIAFAQLAEEYRRAGRYGEAVEACEQGLAHHPGYLSARVTLGRCYLEINELDAAQVELTQVLRAAPENLAALRGMAEVHHRRGELQEALAHYRTALEFARSDPELQHLADQIAKELEPQPAAPTVPDGLSFEEVRDAFLSLSLPDEDSGSPAADAAAAADASLPVIDLTVGSAPAMPAPRDEPVSPTAAGALEAAPAVHAAALALPEGTISLPGVAIPLIALPDPSPEAHADAAPDVATFAESAPTPDVLPEPAAGEMPAGERADDDPQVDALERWLRTIIADRQRRA